MEARRCVALLLAPCYWVEKCNDYAKKVVEGDTRCTLFLYFCKAERQEGIETIKTHNDVNANYKW